MKKVGESGLIFAAYGCANEHHLGPLVHRIHFIHPAVTIACSPSDTCTGIAPTAVPAFVVTQLLGAAATVHQVDGYVYFKELLK